MARTLFEHGGGMMRSLAGPIGHFHVNVVLIGNELYFLLPVNAPKFDSVTAANGAYRFGRFARALP